MSDKIKTLDEEIGVLYNNCYGGWEISNQANKLYKSRKTKNSNFTIRSDPVLIQIYNELGDEFDNDYSSKTSIEKIPKKYENVIILFS